MRISDSVALVTGANRGIGRALVQLLLDGGPRRVYATWRALEAASTSESTDQLSLFPYA